MPNRTANSPVRVRPDPKVPTSLHHRRGVVLQPTVETVAGTWQTLVQLEGRPHPTLLDGDKLDDVPLKSSRRVVSTFMKLARLALVAAIVAVVAVAFGAYSGNKACTEVVDEIKSFDTARLYKVCGGLVDDLKSVDKERLHKACGDVVESIKAVDTARIARAARRLGKTGRRTLQHALHNAKTCPRFEGLPKEVTDLAPAGVAILLLLAALYKLDNVALNTALGVLIVSLALLYARGAPPDEWGEVRSFVTNKGLECDLLTRRDFAGQGSGLLPPGTPPLLSVITSTANAKTAVQAASAFATCTPTGEAATLPVVAVGVLDRWVFLVDIPETREELVKWLVSVADQAEQQAQRLQLGGTFSCAVLGLISLSQRRRLSR